MTLVDISDFPQAWVFEAHRLPPEGVGYNPSIHRALPRRFECFCTSSGTRKEQGWRETRLTIANKRGTAGREAQRTKQDEERSGVPGQPTAIENKRTESVASDEAEQSQQSSRTLVEKGYCQVELSVDAFRHFQVHQRPRPTAVSHQSHPTDFPHSPTPTTPCLPKQAPSRSPATLGARPPSPPLLPFVTPRGGC